MNVDHLKKKFIRNSLKQRERCIKQIEFAQQQARYDADPLWKSAIQAGQETVQSIDKNLRTVGYVIN